MAHNTCLLILVAIITIYVQCILRSLELWGRGEDGGLGLGAVSPSRVCHSGPGLFL